MRVTARVWSFVFISFFMSGTLSAFSQEGSCPGGDLTGRTYYGRQARIEFGCEDLVYSIAGEGKTTHRHQLTSISDVPFIQLYDGSERSWLALFSDQLIFLFDGENKNPFFTGVTGNPRWIETLFFQPEVFTASSFLVEGAVSYAANNLGHPATRQPWVEGVSGSGIGQEIAFDRSLESFWISIGFVSYVRPELYHLNGRPKLLRVLNVDTGAETVVRLKDTPNPQHVLLDDPAQNVRITIEEVYPGARWENTVVNFIAFY